MRNGLPYINPALFAEPTLEEQQRERLAEVRQIVSGAWRDLLERVLEEFPEPAIQQWIVQDVTLFAMFFGSLRTVEAAGGDMEKRQILSAFNHLTKRAEREVPEMILNFSREILQQGQDS